MIIKNTQHVLNALNTLIEVFKDKDNLSAFITALVTQIQDLEDVFIDIHFNTWLDNAYGKSLDGIGEIVKEARQGRSDLDYRNAIKTKIYINLGNGTAEDIIEVVKSLFDNMVVQIIPHYPAKFSIKLKNPIDPFLDIAKIKYYISQTTPVGVGFVLEFFVEGPFQFDIGLGYDLGKYAGAI